ncbi:restriction endonuclease subunit S [Vibrio parahaemolyticus]|nr:restriction endonuclease subunit S [Vibrio parahaemolyticus]EHH1260558.1 hypothetical protein [Vibrio parahaemolyticus]
MVPKGWELVKLDDIAFKVMVGIASAATHAYTNSGVRMLRNLNIKDGWIDDSDILHIEKGYEIQHKNKRLKVGDILTVRTGYPGLSAVVPDIYENAQCFTSLITRLDQTKALPDYVCRFINSEYGKKFIASGEAGGAQKNVNAAMLKKMLIPLPPLSEQQKIAQFLSTWDNAISTTEKMIVNGKQQKKALMQQLLTGKKRLVDSETGKAFESEWDEVRLSKLGTIVSGGTPSTSSIDYWDGDVCWVTPTDITKLRTKVIKNTARKITHLGLKNSSAQLVPAGSLLVCTRATIGELAITQKEMCTNQGFKNIILNKNGNVDFLYYLLSFEKNKLLSKACGSTFLELSKKDFGSLIFNLPMLNEQKAIASVLSTADKEIELLEAKLAHFKQEKKALMQQLLTGKRRVNIAA